MFNRRRTIHTIFLVTVISSCLGNHLSGLGQGARAGGGATGAGGATGGGGAGAAGANAVGAGGPQPGLTLGGGQFRLPPGGFPGAGGFGGQAGTPQFNMMFPGAAQPPFPGTNTLPGQPITFNGQPVMMPGAGGAPAAGQAAGTGMQFPAQTGGFQFPGQPGFQFSRQAGPGGFQFPGQAGPGGFQFPGQAGTAAAAGGFQFPGQAGTAPAAGGVQFPGQTGTAPAAGGFQFPGQPGAGQAATPGFQFGAGAQQATAGAIRFPQQGRPAQGAAGGFQFFPPGVPGQATGGFRFPQPGRATPVAGGQATGAAGQPQITMPGGQRLPGAGANQGALGTAFGQQFFPFGGSPAVGAGAFGQQRSVFPFGAFRGAGTGFTGNQPQMLPPTVIRLDGTQETLTGTAASQARNAANAAAANLGFGPGAGAAPATAPGGGGGGVRMPGSMPGFPAMTGFPGGATPVGFPGQQGIGQPGRPPMNFGNQVRQGVPPTTVTSGGGGFGAGRPWRGTQVRVQPQQPSPPRSPVVPVGPVVPVAPVPAAPAVPATPDMGINSVGGAATGNSAGGQPVLAVIPLNGINEANFADVTNILEGLVNNNRGGNVPAPAPVPAPAAPPTNTGTLGPIRWPLALPGQPQ